MGSNTRHTSTRRLLAGPILATMVLAACAGDDDESAAVEPATAEGTVATDARTLADSEADASDEPGGVRPGEIELGTIGRDVIVELHVTLSSDDIRRSVSSVSASAARLGGGVASSDVSFGDVGDSAPGGYAVLVVKVPPDQVNRLLDDLDATGDVLALNQSAQDVTEQLVDLDVRIDNARQSVANVRAFMERTQNLTELVTLEGELTRRQTELEQLEAQQRNLSERVALATITIEIIPAESAPEATGSDGIGDAFADGWEAFTVFVLGIGFVLAVLAPFVVLAAIVAWVVWRLVVHRRRRAPNTATRTVAVIEADDEIATPTG